MADAALKAAAPSKSQLAYEFIRARIDDGRYVSGFRLVLGQIAGELEISVVPVREAIRRLEAEGLVTFEKNVGAQVALLQDAEYTYTMETLALVEGVVELVVEELLGPVLGHAPVVADGDGVAGLLEAAVDDPDGDHGLGRPAHRATAEELGEPVAERDLGFAPRIDGDGAAIRGELARGKG